MVRTDFLYAKPSALVGWARLLDLGGALNLYNVSRSGAEADARALHADWAVLGQDMRLSIASITAELLKDRRGSELKHV